MGCTSVRPSVTSWDCGRRPRWRPRSHRRGRPPAPTSWPRVASRTRGWAVPGADGAAPPEVFGPYRLDAFVGRGGMGEVFRAFDLRRNRVVALKRMSRHLITDPEYRKRFQRESALAARLREPHIIPIHDYGEINGQLYIDMRLVEGADLATVLERSQLSVERAIDVVSQIADALDAAHAEGLVHRDVKPPNALLVGGHEDEAGSRGFVYLADFGVAATLGGSTLSRPGLAVGSAAYMAPERMIGDEWDRRVDVYSLACVLYECLVRRRPFPGDDLLTLLQAHIKAPPPKPSDLRADLPRGLDAVIAKGMAKDPDARFRTAGALAAAARDILDGRMTFMPVRHSGPSPVDEATVVSRLVRPSAQPPVQPPAEPTPNPLDPPTEMSPAVSPARPDHDPDTESGPAVAPVAEDRDPETEMSPAVPVETDSNPDFGVPSSAVPVSGLRGGTNLDLDFGAAAQRLAAEEPTTPGRRGRIDERAPAAERPEAPDAGGAAAVPPAAAGTGERPEPAAAAGGGGPPGGPAPPAGAGPPGGRAAPGGAGAGAPGPRGGAAAGDPAPD